MSTPRKWLRRTLRRLAAAGLRIVTFTAALTGPGGVRRLGIWLGDAHYLCGGRGRRRLAADIARALDVDDRRAAAILREGYRTNDRAIFEVLTLAEPPLDPRGLVAATRVDGGECLHNADGTPRACILLGLHMGNGILMATRLATDGWPVHLVYRSPRRLPAGALDRSFRRAGLPTVELDRANPVRSFRAMLKILHAGGSLVALMDQGNKSGGIPVEFLGKPMQLPAGVIRLARRSGVPVRPVTTLATSPGWHFRIDAPLDLPPNASEQELAESFTAAMTERIRARPELWSWHQRRWRRYDFA